MLSHEFIEKILNYDEPIEKLIELSNCGESDWLEFKDSLIPRDGVYEEKKKGKEQKADYQWNVAEAVIAMANSYGGAVLIGVAEDKETKKPFANGLFSNYEGHLKDWDSFFSGVIKPAIFSIKGWRTGCAGEWKINCNSLEPYIISRSASYQGKLIGVLIIKPIENNDDLILVEDLKIDREALIVRRNGNVGECDKKFKSTQIKKYRETRQLDTHKFDLLYEKFNAKITKSNSLFENSLPSPPDLDSKIKKHNNWFIKNCRELEKQFTLLDAEENFEKTANIEDDENYYLIPDAEESFYDEYDDEFVGDEWDDDDFDHEEPDNEIDEREYRIARKGTVFELLDLEKRSVFLGEPGAGKTTTLRRKCLQIIKNYSETGITGVFVSLSNFRKDDNLQSLILRNTYFSEEEYLYLLKSNRVILFLDALNECPTSAQPVCVGNLRGLLNAYQELAVTISTRTLNWTQQIELPAFTIKPLTKQQQGEFLAVYIKDKEKSEKLLSQLYSQPGGEVLANNPWMLRMLATIADDDQLPNGRALMYKKYMHIWFVRETKKANKANIKLPWNEDRTLANIANIAATMRINGYTKEAPVSFLKKIFPQEWFEINGAFDRLAQGTLFSLDKKKDIFSFLHETLQEYLTAEYILENPEFLNNIDKNEYSNWEMPLAYAFEIEPEPAAELCNTISKVNYFLAALVLNETFLHTLKLPENLSHFMKATLSVLNITASDAHKITYRQTDIPVISSNTIKYVTKTNNLSINRFKKITDFWKEKVSNNSMLGLCSLDILVLTDNKIRELLPSLSSCHCAINLVESGLMTKEDLLKHVSNATIAINLGEIGWATKEDFQDRIPQWCQNASFEQAIKLVELGWATKKDFQDSIPRWCQKSSFEQTKKLINSGWATKEGFQYRIQQLCQNVSVKQATNLVESGWATKDDFQYRIPQWYQNVSVKQATILVESGWATKDDLLKHISNATIAIKLVELGWATKEDFQDRILQWCKYEFGKQVIDLVESGWATKEDFQDRILQYKLNLFIKTTNFAYAKKLINTGLATWMDILRYTENEKIKQRIIKEGLLKVEFNLLLKTVSFKNAKRAVNVGLATWNDIFKYSKNEETKQKIIDQGLLKVEKNAPPSQKP